MAKMNESMTTMISRSIQPRCGRIFTAGDVSLTAADMMDPGRVANRWVQRSRNLPEIDGHLEIPLIEIGQRGMSAHDARLDIRAGEKHRRCRAVVGAGRAILFHAAAKFAECQDDDALVKLRGLEVIQECF